MAVAAKSTGATKKAIDFTNVRDKGEFNPRHKPAGDYRMKVVKVQDHVAKGKKVADQWCFTIVLTTDQRSSYPYYASWDPEQAWKIRNLCIAAGIQVPKKRILVDPNKIVGKEIGASLDDEEYEGRMKSVISQVFPVSELGGSDEPEDEGDEEVGDEEEVDELDLEEI